MIALVGAAIVLPDRVLPAGTLVIDATTIVSIHAGAAAPALATVVDVHGHTLVPGFVDVHVHGLHGLDTLDAEPDVIAEMASRLPRYGVTAFCPTSVACAPDVLRRFLSRVTALRGTPAPGRARVLAAHLESNFINPDFNGAQPAACLRVPALGVREPDAGDFAAVDIVAAIDAARPDVGIVTLAPELPGGLELVQRLVSQGHVVSLGHSGADFDTAIAAIEAGASQATHLFNRMTPMSHRAPGLPGAVLADDRVSVEVICDGFHVHPVMARLALRAKGAAGFIAITDATAAAGLAVGSVSRLGGRAIRTGERAAFLEDGTLAGSTLTMDQAFRNVVQLSGGSLVDAARACATTPARQAGLQQGGALVAGAPADVTVLDAGLQVVRTIVSGVTAFTAASHGTSFRGASFNEEVP